MAPPAPHRVARESPLAHPSVVRACGARLWNKQRSAPHYRLGDVGRNGTELLAATSKALAEIRGVAHSNGVANELPCLLRVIVGAGHSEVIGVDVEKHLDIFVNKH